MQLSQSLRSDIKNLIMGKIVSGCSVALLDTSDSTITTLSSSNVNYDDSTYTIEINSGIVITRTADVATFVVSKGAEQIFIGSVTQIGYGGDLEFETVSWISGAYVYIGNIIIKEVV